jgi:hypothetical protein
VAWTTSSACSWVEEEEVVLLPRSSRSESSQLPEQLNLVSLMYITAKRLRSKSIDRESAQHVTVSVVLTKQLFKLVQDVKEEV